MSVFGEFRVPTARFVLQETLAALPAVRIEFERVVTTDSLLSPYVWVSTADTEAFEAAAETDPSVRRLHRLDRFERTARYRVEWTDSINSIIAAYSGGDAVLLAAVGTADGWRLQLRFDSRDRLDAFQQHCGDIGVEFELLQLYEPSDPPTGDRYGLTDTQYEALRTAWEMGYFETPRAAGLETVASELGITQQSLSDLLRRSHHALIESTLTVSPDPQNSIKD